jgi:hypothetical protein
MKPLAAPVAAPINGWLVAFVVVIKLAIWLLAGDRYGYMSDELYFLDAGRHPALGYVDFPPLIAWISALLQATGLDSLPALRAFTGAIGIIISLLGIDLCRRLGGSVFAQWVTALVLLLAPGFVSVQGLFTMNVLDQLVWVLAFWLALGYLQTRRPALMLALGVLLGIGVLTKLSILALCLALPLACLIWARDLLLRREVWLAAGLALLVASPYLVWQPLNDWPFLDFIAAYNSNAPTAMVLENPVLGILLTMNPAFALIWAPGALFCLFTRDTALRLLGTSAWLCLGLFVAAGVKFYFTVPLFLLFTPAGALFWDSCLKSRFVKTVRVGIIATLVSGVFALPMAAPLLPDPWLQRLANFLRDSEQGAVSEVPAELERYFPHFAEMHGWPELVELTARSWEQLTPAQREGSVIVASHYGHAAALNILDEQQRLPAALGRHMTYHLWSAGQVYQQALFVGFPETELSELFTEVVAVNRLACQGCMAREQDLPIFFVAGPRLPAAELHARLRRYDFF